MKDKNLLADIESKSLEELYNLANQIIDDLEKKRLEDFINDYQELVKLNNFIERHKFNFEETTHQSLYTCVKETYGKGQLEDTGPLKITSDDQGKPINMYDDTEYN